LMPCRTLRGIASQWDLQFVHSPLHHGC
jgi:hypothetical protein